MNGPVTTVACPNGHASTNQAVCTVCGVPIAAPSHSPVDTTPTAGAIPIVPGLPVLPTRATGAARHLAAAPPIDPTEARHMAPMAPAAPLAPAAPDAHLPPAAPWASAAAGGSADSAVPDSPLAPAAPVHPLPPLPPMPPIDLRTMGLPPAGSALPPGGDPRGLAPALRPPAAEAGYGQVGPGRATTAAGGHLCPHCSAELHPGARFCEVCGYDPSTGSLPHVYAPVVRPAVIPGAAPVTGASGPTSSSFGTPSAPAAASTPGPAPVTGRWTATITADRAYYESHQVGDVEFPLGVPPRTIELPVGPVSIGRRSRSRGTNPAVDLAGPPEDPAVSHTHASLLPSDDGAWKLIDHGSTNGTYVNESLDPLAANQPLAIAPGDRVYVGAWTRISLEYVPLQ
jgi:FHA domain